MVSVEIIIPPKLTSQSRNLAFQWSLSNYHANRTWLIDTMHSYAELHKITINGFIYEKIIFDFNHGIVQLRMKTYCEKAILSLLQMLTVYTETGYSFLANGEDLKNLRNKHK